MSYSITLPVNPVPCPRPQFNLRSGATYYSKIYNTFKAEAARALPGALMAAGLNSKLLGPLIVSLLLRVTQPKKTKLEFPKPDVDNYCKSVLDACNGLAWEDDYQVVALHAEKEWAAPGVAGEVIITIKELRANS